MPSNEPKPMWERQDRESLAGLNLKNASEGWFDAWVANAPSNVMSDARNRLEDASREYKRAASSLRKAYERLAKAHEQGEASS